MAGNSKLRITKDELLQSLGSGQWAERFPPILTVNQAAEFLAVPKSTFYSWHSQGRLKGCTQRLGKHLRIFRDRLALLAMNDGL